MKRTAAAVTRDEKCLPSDPPPKKAIVEPEEAQSLSLMLMLQFMIQWCTEIKIVFCAIECFMEIKVWPIKHSVRLCSIKHPKIPLIRPRKSLYSSLKYNYTSQ